MSKFVLTAEQTAWFEKMRAEWRDVMQPFSGFLTSSAFVPLRQLSTVHTRNCRVLPDRKEMLKLLQKGQICAEIGTQQGYFAQAIWELCEPRELHLYDSDFAPFASSHLLPADQRITTHEGDSSTNLALMPDEYFDFIYIDGDHSYDGVKKDVDVAARKIKRHGLIAFNDYIYWSYLEQFPYGVPHAVNDLCIDDNWEMVYFCLNPNTYFDVAVRRQGAADG